jgi:hypothetical protein
MSAPIRVELPSRGAVLEFEAGTPESVISSVIRRDFSRNGSDVAFDLSQDDKFDRSMTVDDFKLYEQYMQERKSNFLDNAASAAGSVAQVLGKGLLGLFESQNLNPAVAAGTVVEAGAQGTRQLYGMLAQAEDPSSVFFRFKDWINGTGKPEERLNQWKEAREFARKTEALDKGDDTVTGIPSEYVNNDVKNALALVADPTLLIPGIGEAMGASRLASRAFGSGLEAGAKAARLVTAPVAGAVDAATEAALRASGPNAAALRGAAAATGITGVVMGVPGVREAAGLVGGIKLADKVAEIAARAGQNLAEGGSRIGPMEAVGMAPNAGKIDRAVGVVGRYGGDRAIDLGLAGAAGALEGSAIGAGLGYLSGGAEGAAAGFGSGGVLGGVAGTGVRAFDTARGKVAAENRAADFRRFLENADEPTRKNFELIAKRDGLDAAVNTMDIRNLLEGSLKDATFTVLDDVAFKERFGTDARGVQVINAGQPEVVINSSKMASNYTAGHELFHALDSVEQLRPQAERIKQEIVGTFVTQPDGKVVQASEGLLSPSEVEARFDEYKSKAPANPEWEKASTFAEKARLVSNELGAEYMGRLISGSNPDEMLRGFSGVTRHLLDMALTRDANSRLRQLADGLGLGAKPVESIVFKDLQAASPALNGMLRDLVRARRNLAERMMLADATGVVIQKKDINSPVVAQKALEMGVAARNADGSVSLKPDDVLAKEDASNTEALRNVVATTPVADVTKPHLRVVDDKIVGSGISPEQLAAIQSAPGMSNKLREALTHFSNSVLAQAKAGEGNVLFMEYGAATKRVKSRLTGKWTSRYSSGIRVSQREVAPYSLYISEAGNPVAKVVDISKLRADASDLASRGRLGPYAADMNGFLADSVRYFDNISDPNGVRTKDLPGMTPDKAAFLNQHFGQDEKGGAKFIRDIRLDRIIQMRPTGERIAASELAWQRQKVNWMPAEKMPEGEVWSSPQKFRVVKTPSGKFHLYGPDGQRVGVYDTQGKAEAKAQKEANLGRSISEIKRDLGPEDRKALIDAEKRITQVARENPEAVRLVIQRDQSGMPKIALLEDADGNPVLDDKGRQKRGVVFEKVSYDLRNAPGLSRVDDVAVKQGADLLEKDAKQSLQRSSIRKGLGWYQRMREFFQRELGANIEVFGQLLGATSARTPVDTNFRQALEALKLFSSGAYDDLVQRYHEHVTRVKQDAASGKLFEDWKQENQGKSISQFSLNDEVRKRINDFDEVPLRSNGAKYNANSKKVLQVLYGNWVEQTKGPKTPNFAGNLTGRTLAATIDVWAARNLRRLLYEGKRRQWRLLPEQETGVDYLLDKNGTYGGDFVFAQKIYEEVGRRLNINPDDLQALMWFAEKDVWDRNGWTNSVGGEKSSFDKEAGKLNLRRYQAGVTTFRDEATYSPERQRAAANEIREAINKLEVDRYGRGTKEPGSVVSRVTFTEGLYGDVIEPSLDVEFSLQRRTNPMPVLQKLVDIASRPESLQTDVFLSKLVESDHANARPGMEIGFKKPASQQDIQAVMKVFRENGIDGFTVAKDQNGKTIGIRTQYVPEISGRYDAQHLDPQNFTTFAKDWMANARKAKAALDGDNISYANEAHFSTHVVGREEYGRKFSEDLLGASTSDELGRRRHAIEAGSGEVLRGDSGGQTPERPGSGNAGRDDAGPAAASVGQAQFMPDLSGRLVSLQPEAMPNGTVYRSNVGFNVVNKAGGKYRVYSPVGILVGVANSLEESQRMIERKVK